MELKGCNRCNHVFPRRPHAVFITKSGTVLDLCDKCDEELAGWFREVSSTNAEEVNKITE